MEKNRKSALKCGSGSRSGDWGGHVTSWGKITGTIKNFHFNNGSDRCYGQFDFTGRYPEYRYAFIVIFSFKLRNLSIQLKKITRCFT